MNASKTIKAMLLLLALAFIPMMGFSQNDDRKEQAKEAALSLTETMADSLILADIQKDMALQCNMSYTMALFTSEPLTDDVITISEATLDSCLKEILDSDQYSLWAEKRKDWLDKIKAMLPVVIEEALE